jgi:hypothetical protein
MVNERLTRDNRQAEVGDPEACMRWRRLAGAGAVLVGSAVQAWAGPAVATRWQQVQGSQEECLQRAEDAIRRTGFGRLERTQQSRYGSTGDYTVVIRCIVSNGLAIFIVSGPARDRADQMAGALFENWK